MSELSPEALSLIVTAYPIGIGLVALEVFRLAPVRRVRMRFWIHNRASARMLVALCFPAFFAVLVAFWAVVNDLQLHTVGVWFVQIAGALLAVAVGAMLLELFDLARALDRDQPRDERPAPLAAPAPTSARGSRSKGKPTPRRRRKGGR
jgi:hypothetical protein